MASAQIIFHQPQLDGYVTPGSRDDLSLGSPVYCVNVNDTGVSTWLWTMVEQPEGSAALLTPQGGPGPNTSTSQFPTFTPDVVGTYLIKLSVNGGAATDQKGAGIKTANLHYRIPAATESLEFDGYRGWSVAVNRALKAIDDGYNSQPTPNIQAVYTASLPSSFVVNSTNGPFQIRDSNPAGSSVFEVTSNVPTSKYMVVGSAGTSFFTSVDLGNHRITSLATPSVSSDAATKGYVDGAVSGTATLQVAYNGSNPAQVVINSTNGALSISDGYVPVNNNLFEIDGYNLSTKYVTMDRTGVFSIKLSGSASTQSTPNTGTTPAIFGSGPTDIYIGGSTTGSKVAHSTGNGTWTSVTDPGPIGEVVTAIAAPSSSAVYAATNNGNTTGGIYYSTNTGASWTQQLSTQVTALYALDTTHLFAAGGGGTTGKIYTSNGGGSWTNTTTLGHYVNGIWAISSTLVLAVTGSGGDGFIFRSTNGGTSFSSVFSTGGSANIYSIWASDSSNVYAVGDGLNVYFSSDGGATWTSQATGITGNATKIKKVFGTGPHNIYITTDGTGTNTIFRSNGNGVWLPKNNAGQTTGQDAIWGTPNAVYVTTDGQNLVIELAPSGGDVTVGGSVFTTSLAAAPGSVISTNVPMKINGITVDPNATTPTNGQALVYNGTEFVPATVATSPTLQQVYNNGTSGTAGDINVNANKDPLRVIMDGYVLTTNDGLVLRNTNVGTLSNPAYSPGIKFDGYAGINGSGTAISTLFAYNNPNYLGDSSTPVNNLVLAGSASGNSPVEYLRIGYDNSTRTIFDSTNGTNPNGMLFISSTGGPGTPYLFNVIDAAQSSSSRLNIDAAGLVTITQNARIQGTASIHGYTVDPGFTTPNTGQALIYNGSAYVPSDVIGGPNILDNTNEQLTDTSPFTILSFLVPADGDYVIYAYYRVTSAPTDFRMTLNWTDQSGPQSEDLVPFDTQNVGSYNIAPVYISAANGTGITVTATAGTANNIFTSASLLQMLTSGVGLIPPIQEKANIFDFQLTTTSATNVFIFTPGANGNYVIYIYFRVANAITNVTLTLTWTDNASAQTMSIVGPAASKAIGSYSLAPVYIQAISGNAITLSATSGTANNLFVSATATLV